MCRFWTLIRMKMKTVLWLSLMTIKPKRKQMRKMKMKMRRWRLVSLSLLSPMTSSYPAQTRVSSVLLLGISADLEETSDAEILKCFALAPPG